MHVADTVIQSDLQEGDWSTVNNILSFTGMKFVTVILTFRSSYQASMLTWFLRSTVGKVPLYSCRSETPLSEHRREQHTIPKPTLSSAQGRAQRVTVSSTQAYWEKKEIILFFQLFYPLTHHLLTEVKQWFESYTCLLSSTRSMFTWYREYTVYTLYIQ